jgi:hypothetical protein
VSFNTATGYRSWCPDGIGTTALTQGITLTGQVSNQNPLYYHLCTLFLPQGGNQARITVNFLNDYRMNTAGTGANAGKPVINQPYAVYNPTTTTFTNPVQNMLLVINIYSSNGSKTGTTTYTGGSNQCTNYATATNSTLVSNGVFWGGFGTLTTTTSAPNFSVLLAPSTTDILNYVDVWMYGYPNMGTPLLTVVQTAGSVSNLTQTGAYAPLPVATPPASGYLKLPVTLTQILLL